MLVLGAFAFMPAKAEAGSIFDPFCLWSGCDDDNSSSVTNNTNSNNVNSNVNSPGGVVVADNYNSNVGTPVYAYDNDSSNGSNSSLRVSCYVMPLSIREGQSATWTTSIYGGNGSYHVTWSGTDGLSGTGSSITKRYNNDGTKNASVRVVSGSQTVTRNCDSDLRVYADNYYDDDYDYDYDDDYYDNLRVTCSPNRTFGYDGSVVTWTAYPTGGTGSYSYSWDGSDSLRGSGRSVSKTYYDDGDKYARVVVRSGGRSVTERCDDEVTIDDRRYNNNTNYNQVVMYPTQTNTLDIGCFADPASIRVNQPSTWTAEVVGGYGPYNYSWSGTDGMSGNQSSVVKYYSTTGDKSAVVTVTSADGKTGSRSCTNTVTVRSASQTTTPAPTKVTPATDDDGGLSASALFSLKNVPWGWVAILVILVLFATVMYLLFNRTKI